MRRLIKNSEVPNDLKIKNEVYLEVGTDKAIEECLESDAFAVCYNSVDETAIYFIDGKVMSRSVFLHELKHASQLEYGGWPKGPKRYHSLSDGKDNYDFVNDRIEAEATEYAIKHTSVAEHRDDIIDGFKWLKANKKRLSSNLILKKLTKRDW